LAKVYKGGKTMKKMLSILMIACAVFTNARADDNKILVAYFSATGNTKAVASTLATAINADLFEIVPEQPYTSEDLNWQNNQSRTSIEMDDRSSRPAIASKIEDISQYNIVFVGSPIWWGREPSIMDTFIESYDFTGKTIIPFVTSGSSDIGDYGANLQSLTPNVKVLTGKRFPNNVTSEELKTWADEQMQKGL
jgi:flavodoxin